MTPSSRIGSLTTCAAATLVFLVLSCSSTSAIAASPRAGSDIIPPLYVPDTLASAGGTRHLRSSDAAFGQVDVFIDLACHKSAAAWPTLKRIVKDQRHRVDFVFHILPLSDYPIGYFAAKAAQVILANSDGTYDDVERFIDWVFRGQRIILYEQNMEMTLDVRDIVADWALSSSSLSAEQLYSYMEDPAFDEKVLGDLENRFLLAVDRTPTVLINGIFKMYLDGDKQLQDFEIFLEDPGVLSDDEVYTYDTGDDDADEPSPWLKIEQEARDDYEEMQRTRKAAQVAREKAKFEQIEKRAREQLRQLDVQQQEQLKQLLLLQQDQLNHLRLQQDQQLADLQRTARSSPSSSSSALGFSTSRYTLSVPSEYDPSPPSSSFSSSSSSSSSTTTTRLPPLLSSSSSFLSPSTSSSSPPPPPPPAWLWSTFSSFVSSVFSSDCQEVDCEGVNETSAGDAVAAEAEALEADSAARGGEQPQKQGVWLGQTWYYVFFRSVVGSYTGRSEVTLGEGSVVQERSSGAGGDGGVEEGFEVGEEGINFEAAAATNVVAVKI